jgi:hypothetical protein
MLLIAALASISCPKRETAFPGSGVGLGHGVFCEQVAVQPAPEEV